MRLLLVEDDTILGSAIRDAITADGHAVDWATQLEDARHCLHVATYSGILLDVVLPDGCGLSFLVELRRKGRETPVIMLTALDQVSDRIAGLNAGADDYLVKPFNLSELAARIHAVTRRAQGRAASVMRLGPFTVSLVEHRLERDGEPITLTAREWAVLEALIERLEGLVSKASLEERLYAFDTEIESNTIEVYIARLRKKLGHSIIETERGLGYRLRMPVDGVLG